MSNTCENCVHNPICEWCEEHTKEFFRPKDSADHCYMFCNEEPCDEPAESADCVVTAHFCHFDHTIELMRSPFYKDRFRAEYMQTKIRYEKLKAFNTRIEAAQRTALYGVKTIEEPNHTCPEDILRDQQRAMGEYLHILEVRAVIEGIEL